MTEAPRQSEEPPVSVCAVCLQSGGGHDPLCRFARSSPPSPETPDVAGLLQALSAAREEAGDSEDVRLFGPFVDLVVEALQSFQGLCKCCTLLSRHERGCPFYAAASPRSSLTAPTELKEALDRLESAREHLSLSRMSMSMGAIRSDEKDAESARSKVEEIFKALRDENEQIDMNASKQILGLIRERDEARDCAREYENERNNLSRDYATLLHESNRFEQELSALRRERDELLKQVQPNP